jgi:hypothetical protein
MTASIPVKAYRIAMGCETPAQARVALAWLERAYKAYPRLVCCRDYYTRHLHMIISRRALLGTSVGLL